MSEWNDELERTMRLTRALLRDEDGRRLDDAVRAGIIDGAQAVAILNLWHRSP